MHNTVSLAISQLLKLNLLVNIILATILIITINVSGNGCEKDGNDVQHESKSEEETNGTAGKGSTVSTVVASPFLKLLALKTLETKMTREAACLQMNFVLQYGVLASGNPDLIKELQKKYGDSKDFQKFLEGVKLVSDLIQSRSGENAELQRIVPIAATVTLVNSMAKTSKNDENSAIEFVTISTILDHEMIASLLDGPKGVDSISPEQPSITWCIVKEQYSTSIEEPVKERSIQVDADINVTFVRRFKQLSRNNPDSIRLRFSLRDGRLAEAAERR